jgi:hypothetical protein
MGLESSGFRMKPEVEISGNGRKEEAESGRAKDHLEGEVAEGHETIHGGKITAPPRMFQNHQYQRLTSILAFLDG